MRPARSPPSSTEPTSCAGDRLGRDAGGAVAFPVPVTVPAPDCLPKVMTVELSEVTVLPAASRIVAVRTRVAPEVRLAVEPVRTMSAAAPWTTVKAPRVPVVRPAAVASIVTEPTSAPVIVFVATPLGRGRGAGAGDGAGTGLLGEGDDGGVVGGDGVAGGVLDRGGQDAGRAGGEVGGGAGEAMSAAAPWTTVKAPRVPVVSPAAVASIVTEPTSCAGDRLGGDAAGRGCGAGAGDGAGTGLLGEGDDGGVVAGDGVAGGVLDRRRQDARRAGGEVGRRAGERDLGGGAVDDGEGAEGAGGETGRGGFHRDRADERAGDRLGRDAARPPSRCRCR